MSYTRGLAVAHLGSLAISDKDLNSDLHASAAYRANLAKVMIGRAVESLAHEMKDNAWALKSSALLEADRVMGKVRTALVANAVITGISTGVLVLGALKIARSRGFQ